ncbi:hypothetical protein VCRA2122O339_80021 [Vibrio crassostreae]|nr:hypothetical protein VCRA2120E331_70143 [Vibrio crassostreae]CAK3616920.1 hypothetical protein VCRA2127O345_70143 [Vibrio crassostreae]CAK3627702.1 hypothetical protein VCRA2120E330_80021 [Vibrio crassostreae]CAK3651003.1 hypothetical protein VCRA2122O338_70143 [Vibrio crassostreae]CAK3661382.1 hypothetical protein VCRA2122O339_80021 [Vibrio crassostreae]
MDFCIQNLALCTTRKLYALSIRESAIAKHYNQNITNDPDEPFEETLIYLCIHRHPLPKFKILKNTINAVTQDS